MGYPGVARPQNLHHELAGASVTFRPWRSALRSPVLATVDLAWSGPFGAPPGSYALQMGQRAGLSPMRFADSSQRRLVGPRHHYPTPGRVNPLS
jgi:hypothetical protein